jgi:hypothetical protein
LENQKEPIFFLSPTRGTDPHQRNTIAGEANMKKVANKIVNAMSLASPGFCWRHLSIGAQRNETRFEDYPAIGSCVGGIV